MQSMKYVALYRDFNVNSAYLPVWNFVDSFYLFKDFVDIKLPIQA